MDERGRGGGGRTGCTCGVLAARSVSVMSEVIDLTIDSGSDFESDISAINSPLKKSNKVEIFSETRGGEYP